MGSGSTALIYDVVISPTLYTLERAVLMAEGPRIDAEKCQEGGSQVNLANLKFELLSPEFFSRHPNPHWNPVAQELAKT